MENNKLAYLASIGLIGFLGIPTGNFALFGFFGFFGFLPLFLTKNDELLQENIGKASSNAFIVSVFGLAITLALLAVLENESIAIIGIAVTYILQILTYSLSVGIYEKNNAN